MYISNLYLKNYRNISNIELTLGEKVNIFYGDNAQGKTNLLESIYICATGRSHRTHKDKDLIQFGYENAHIKTMIKDRNTTNKMDIHLKKYNRKGIAINNIPIKKIGELFGYVNIIMFSPEDLSIIKQGPQDRRKFIDIELCQISSIYNYNLSQYYKILKQRNAILKNSKKYYKNNDRDIIDNILIWDEQLVNTGIKIIKNREEFIEKINIIASEIHKNITDGKENLSIKYKPSVDINEFSEKLIKNIDKDIMYTSTSYGPHKDDIIFFINDINIREFGSQGQQRTAILSVKLAEVELIKQEKEKYPILLLDDVLSELDKTRQEFLINNINDMQVIITCTGVDDIIKRIENKIINDDNIACDNTEEIKIKNKICIFEVLNGVIL